MSNATLYDLVHIKDGKVIEVLLQDKPKYACQIRANIAKKASHKKGLLQSRKVTNRPKDGWLQN